MKSYILVSNDEKEIPMSEEILGREALLDRLYICESTLQRYMRTGFPVNFKYKVKVVKEKQIEDLKQYYAEYKKTHNRKKYHKEYYELGKKALLK